jgi:hypothetical protein
VWRLFVSRRYGLFEIAGVLVRFDHVARFIVNANHGIMRAAEMLDIADCVTRCRFSKKFADFTLLFLAKFLESRIAT